MNSNKNFEIIKNHNKKNVNISVIITLYNYERYICKAIDSVLKNKFKNLEIVVVNDCSKDNSYQKVLPYLSKKCNLTLIDKFKNSGLIDSRNLGIDICVGDYIFILDADNYLYDDCLEKHFYEIKKNDAIACYGIIDCFDEENNLVRHVSNMNFNYEKLKLGNYIDAMAMFHKEKLIKIGKYDANLQKVGIGWEDFELWLRIGSLGYKVNFINQPLSRYLIKKESMLINTEKKHKINLANYLNNKYNAFIK